MRYLNPDWKIRNVTPEEARRFVKELEQKGVHHVLVTFESPDQPAVEHSFGRIAAVCAISEATKSMKGKHVLQENVQQTPDSAFILILCSSRPIPKMWWVTNAERVDAISALEAAHRQVVETLRTARQGEDREWGSGK